MATSTSVMLVVGKAIEGVRHHTSNEPKNRETPAPERTNATPMAASIIDCLSTIRLTLRVAPNAIRMPIPWFAG